MPDTSRPTAEELKAKQGEILKVLSERGVSAACPRCGHKDWEAGAVGYLISPLHVGEGIGFPPPHVPMLNLTCLNCGATQLHNLSVLGIKI